jgi:hypothetical protein
VYFQATSPHEALALTKFTPALPAHNYLTIESLDGLDLDLCKVQSAKNFFREVEDFSKSSEAVELFWWNDFYRLAVVKVKYDCEARRAELKNFLPHILHYKVR